MFFTFDEWEDWVKQNYYPRTNFEPHWKLLGKEPEFQDEIAVYSNIEFKTFLQAISTRRSESSQFCQGLLKTWDRKTIGEKGVLSYSMLS